MLDKLKTALVLFVIGSLSGLIIFGVNNLTVDTIAENKRIKEETYYLEIFNLTPETIITFEKNELDNGLDQEIVIYDKDGIVLGYIYKALDKNNYGDVTVLVGINIDGTISNVVIADTSNTPTFVNRIKSKFIGNFVGQDTDSISYDSKTGATYTYTSVAKIVDNSSAYYLESRGE